MLLAGSSAVQKNVFTKNPQNKRVHLLSNRLMSCKIYTIQPEVLPIDNKWVGKPTENLLWTCILKKYILQTFAHILQTCTRQTLFTWVCFTCYFNLLFLCIFKICHHIFYTLQHYTDYLNVSVIWWLVVYIAYLL